MVVAGDPVDAAGVVGAAAAGIGRTLVDAVVAAVDDRVVVVVELAGEEIGPGETVVLRPVVAVVFMGAEGVDAKSTVLRRVRRQAVVVAEKDGLVVATDQQLGRQGAVEGPERQRPLVRQAGVEGGTQGCRRIDAGVQARGYAGVVGLVGLGAFLGDFHHHFGEEGSPLLVRPDRARRTALDGALAAAQHRRYRLQRGIGLRGRIGARHTGVGRDRVHHPRAGRESLARQHVEAWHRLGESQDAEQRAGWQPGGDVELIGVGAAGEGTQAVDRDQQSAGGGQAPSDEVAPGDLAPGDGGRQLREIPSGIFRFPEACL
ncbi:hypothetical protein D9M69_400230 [compost metagenome]